MPTKSILFALFAYTGSVITSPLPDDGDIFANDCEDRALNDRCKTLGPLSLGLDGFCKDVDVSSRSNNDRMGRDIG
jgi:hypothetical protein